MKPITVKLLEGNTGSNPENLGYSAGFLDTTPKAQFLEAIIDKLDFINIKNIFSDKGTIERIRKQATDWEKIFTKHRPYKGLVFKIKRKKRPLKTHQQENKQYHEKVGIHRPEQIPHRGRRTEGR